MRPFLIATAAIAAALDLVSEDPVKLTRYIPATLVAVALLMLTTFAAGGSVRAQSSDESHPVHIHNGTCATLGSIAWMLNDLNAPGAPVTMMGTPASGTTKAQPSPLAGTGQIVAESTTVVKVHLTDLEKAPFSINAHESVAKISDYIACGDITGAIANNTLVVPLKELNGSGLSGSATLKDDGTGMTTVSIVLMRQGSAAGTPATIAGRQRGTDLVGADGHDGRYRVQTDRSHDSRQYRCHGDLEQYRRLAAQLFDHRSQQ